MSSRNETKPAVGAEDAAHGVDADCYRECGSLRGTVKIATADRAELDEVFLVDRLSGEETRCHFDDDSFAAKLRDVGNRRVVLAGDIYVDRTTRKPRKIVIRELRIIPPSSELPQLEDLAGIDITGGMDSVEYVRRMRDDE
jgi:hypothetical protein